MCLLLLALLADPEPKAPPAPPGPDFHVVPWGLITGDGKAAFVRGEDGIAALNATTGELVWATVEGPFRPLALGGGLLLTREAVEKKPNALRIVAFDFGTGRAKWQTEPVVLPDWVAVEKPPWGRAFHAEAVVDKGSLLVRWKANAWWNKGAAPTREEERAARKEAEGVLKVSLKGGKVERLGADAMPLAKEPRSLFTVERVRDGGRRVLLQWPDGRKLPLIELAVGHVLPVAALDRKSVAVVWPDKGKGKLFSAATGKEIGAFTPSTGVVSVDVAGGRVLLLSERIVPGGGLPPRYKRTLEAHDPKTGKALWSRDAEARIEHRLPR